MAFYYVKSGGTAAGDAGRATTARTGSFAVMGASAYYDSIYDVFAGGIPATAPASGDTILVSDVHNKMYSVAASYAIAVSCAIISVQDSDCSAESTLPVGTGATEDTYTNSVSGDWEITANPQHMTLIVRGVTFKPYGKLIGLSSQISRVVYVNCCFTISKVSWQHFQPNEQQTSRAEFINCKVNQASPGNNDVSIYRSYNTTFIGGEITLGRPFAADHVNLRLYGVDLSGCTNELCKNLNSWNSPNTAIYVDRCLFPSDSYSLGSSSIWPGAKVIATRCGAGNSYFIDRSLSNYGEVDTDTANYLNATYDGTNGFSLLLSSNANTSASAALRHKLLEIPAIDLSTSKTIRVNTLTDNVVLKDSEFWVEVVYPDNTELALSVFQSSQNSNYLSAGVDLSADTTNTWTSPGVTTDEERYIEETLPALSNADNANIEIWVCLAKPNIDVWIDPAVVVS